MRAVLTVVIVTCLAASTGAGARSGDPLAVVPLSPYAGKLKTVTVRIGDTESPFLFDTGGGATCITPELAASLGCTPYGRATGFRLTGERLEFEWCDDMTLVIGEVPLDVEVAVFDLQTLLGDAPPVSGLVSVHTFAHHPFTLDLDHETLVIESAESLAHRTTSMRPLSARFAQQAGGASLDPFVEVGAPHGSLWLELDSGNIGRTILAPHAPSQLGIAADPDGRIPLEILGLGVVPLGVRVVEGCIYDGVLGVEVFAGRTITFDAENDVIWASP